MLNYYVYDGEQQSNSAVHHHLPKRCAIRTALVSSNAKGGGRRGGSDRKEYSYCEIASTYKFAFGFNAYDANVHESPPATHVSVR